VTKPLKVIIVLGLVAVLAMSVGACGDDDDDPAAGADASGDTAAAPPPDRAFRNFETAVAAQGLEADPLPEASLNGAESGVGITGDKQGSARLFATQAEAKDYAAEVATEGDKTTVVGTVVFQADTQDDADFFADAYE
jgi:hypothetical protein